MTRYYYAIHYAECPAQEGIITRFKTARARNNWVAKNEERRQMLYSEQAYYYVDREEFRYEDIE